MFMWRVAQPTPMGDHPPVRTALYHEHLALNANMVDDYGHISSVDIDAELATMALVWCSDEPLA